MPADSTSPESASPDPGLADAVGNMAQYLNERGGRQMKQQTEEAQTDIVHNVTKGTITATMPADVFKEKAEAAAKYDEIAALYMKQVNDLEQQRAQIKAHPFANTLAQIAGSMAAADSNPVTAGLGRAALKLNPTDAELQAREQAPLEGARQTQTQKVASTQAIERTGVEEQRQLRLEKSAALTAERDEALQKETERRNRAQEELTGKRLDVQQKIAESKEGSSERIAAMRDKTLIDAALIRERAQQNAFEMKDEATQRKAAGKEMEVPKSVPDKLVNLSAAEKSLDNIEAKIKKYSHLQGQIAGRTLAPVTSYLDKEASQFFTNLQLEVAQTIKSTGAGARGFGPMERGFFEKLATAKTHSPEENLGVIEAWRDYIRQNRSAYVDAYKGLSDKKYEKILGKDSNLIDGSDDKKGDPLGIR